MFRGAVQIAAAPSHTLHHGWAVETRSAGDEDGARIDEVVVAVFRAPRSYTREDVVEISCHGGALIARIWRDPNLIGHENRAIKAWSDFGGDR